MEDEKPKTKYPELAIALILLMGTGAVWVVMILIFIICLTAVIGGITTITREDNNNATVD